MEDKDKLFSSLKSFSKRHWRERWFGREIQLGDVVDITPLIDFGISVFVSFMEEKFFRLKKERLHGIRELFKSDIRKEVDKTHIFSADQLAEIEADILRTVLPDLEEDRLSSGIRMLSNYDEVKTVLGTRMRWRIISCLSRKSMIAKELSKTIPEAREEAIRRAVEQMVKIGIVKIESRLVEGRALKEYKLNTSVLIVDLR